MRKQEGLKWREMLLATKVVKAEFFVWPKTKKVLHISKRG